MSHKRYHQKLIERTIDKYSSDLERQVVMAQSNMWSTVLNKMKALETDSLGNVLPTPENLKILRDVKKIVTRAATNSPYKKGVKEFLNAFSNLRSINNQMLGIVSEPPTAAANYSLSIEATKNSLLAHGLEANVVAPVEQVIKQSITSGASFADMTTELRTLIVGSEGKLGSMERYVGQIARDALNQYNATHNTSIAKDLDIVFYVYEGPIKETSRQYCKDMVGDGRWFHIREIEESASRDWKGKNRTTNASNILINRGGYNCQHQFIPVSTEAVPKQVIERAKTKGYISE